MRELDQRTGAYKLLNNAYLEIISDVGGEQNLSHVKLAIIERFVFLEFVMRRLEYKIARSPKKSAVLLGRWIQAINSLNGLAKMIGMQRRAKKVTSLSVYTKDKKGKE